MVNKLDLSGCVQNIFELATVVIFVLSCPKAVLLSLPSGNDLSTVIAVIEMENAGYVTECYGLFS